MTKATLIGSLLLALLVAMAAVFHWRSSEPVPDSPHAASDRSADAVMLEKMQTPDVQGPAWNVDDEPATESAIAAERAQLKPRTASEQVLGVNVKRDRNCTVRIVSYRTLDDGSQLPIHSCVPDEPKEQITYQTYSQEALETLAYSDADAAMALARRLIHTDYDTAVEYGFRSAALSGDTRPVNQLLVMTPQSMTNQESYLDSLKRRYILSGVLLSMDARSTEHQKNMDRAIIYEGDGFDFARLDREIARHVATMQSIKSEAGIH